MPTIQLTPEERMLLQGVHAREQQLRPVIDELNDDRDHVVARIAARAGAPASRLRFHGPSGTAYVMDEDPHDADADPREDDRP